jgi:hypothetical protein
LQVILQRRVVEQYTGVMWSQYLDFKLVIHRIRHLYMGMIEQAYQRGS